MVCPHCSSATELKTQRSHTHSSFFCTSAFPRTPFVTSVRIWRGRCSSPVSHQPSELRGPHKEHQQVRQLPSWRRAGLPALAAVAQWAKQAFSLVIFRLVCCTPVLRLLLEMGGMCTSNTHGALPACRGTLGANWGAEGGGCFKGLGLRIFQNALWSAWEGFKGHFRTGPPLPHLLLSLLGEKGRCGAGVEGGPEYVGGGEYEGEN